MPRSILGAVIAGGRASRFGSDKALAMLEGRPLIAHAVGVLEPFVGRVVVCGREWGGLVSLADPAPDLGPLGGISAALDYAEAEGFEGVLTIACDMPKVPAALVEALLGCPASYCADAPILGVWPVSAASDLRALLLAQPHPVTPAEAGISGGKGGTGVAGDPSLRWGDRAVEAAGSPGPIGKRRELSIRRWADAIGAVPVPCPGLRNINTPADLA